MPFKPHKIAQHDSIRWVSESDDAGPYHIMIGPYEAYASFGTRSIAIDRPGSVRQQESFHVSRAAFYAIRDSLIESPDQGKAKLVKVATVAARRLWKKWEDSIYRFGSGCLSGYTNAVAAATDDSTACHNQPSGLGRRVF